MPHYFCGLESDGASVMWEEQDVSKISLGKVSFLISNHCIAHRLALASMWSVTFIKYFPSVLVNLEEKLKNTKLVSLMNV